MVKLKIKDKEFELCTEWSDVNYKQYINILFIQEDKGFEDLMRSIKIIAALTDKPEMAEEYILNELDTNDLVELSKEMKWIDKDFIKETEKIKPSNSFEIEGVKYTIKKDFNKLTLNEESSFETLIKNKNLNTHQVALGVLLRKLDKEGKEEKFNLDFVNYVMFELIEKIKLIEFYSVISFFLRGVKKPSKKISKGFSIVRKK